MEPNSDHKDEHRKPLLEVPTPWGAFRLRGHDLVSVVLVLFTCFVTYIFWEIREDSADSHKAILQQGVEHTFILHLGSEERAALKLPMPDSLRKRVGEEEY